MKTYRNVFLATLTALAVTVPAWAAKGQNPEKVDRALAGALKSGKAQKIIITTQPGERENVKKALAARGKNKFKAEHASLDLLVGEFSVEDVLELAKSKKIKALSLDEPVYGQQLTSLTGNLANSDSVVADSLTSLSSSLGSVTTTLRQTLGLSAVASGWNAPKGSGIGVAVIDSGIASSANFSGRITGFYDFTNGRNGLSVAPYDDYGHGTHVAALIGSSGVLSAYTLQGVAPGVRLVGLKVLDGTGAGSTSDVIAALQYVTANKSKLNVQVVNMSLGHPINAAAANDPLVQAVQQASAVGLIVVVSAGNIGKNPDTGQVGYAGITSPCNAPSAICVGAANTQNTATRSDDVVAPYSSRGPSWYDGYAKPDLLAPGHKLVADTSVSSYLYSTLLTGQLQLPTGQRVLSLSGTSMAAGVASGVVALVLEAHNQADYFKQKPLTTNAVKAILQYSAIKLPNENYLSQGAGEINAAGAIALAHRRSTRRERSGPGGSRRA